jgi:transcriptional regulator GlxA family with amidase domain
MGSAPERRFRSRPRADRPDLATTLSLRDYEGVKRIFEPRSAVQAVLTALEAAGAAGATAEALARDTGLSPRTVLRCLYWMMKYDFAE